LGFLYRFFGEEIILPKDKKNENRWNLSRGTETFIGGEFCYSHLFNFY
jgi:hypothetical protein